MWLFSECGYSVKWLFSECGYSVSVVCAVRGGGVEGGGVTHRLYSQL